MYTYKNNLHRVSCLVFLLLFAPLLGAQTIPLENSRFDLEKDAENPLKSWVFESLNLEVNPETASAKLINEPKGDAELVIPESGKGIILAGTTETCRGDLISKPIQVEPFRWVEVTVEYAIETGEPLPFVCLRPAGDRSLVDLEFLPKASAGKKTKATVKLHTGLSSQPYALSVSITGIGKVRILSIRAREKGDYPRPEKPLLVLDMLHVKPPRDGKLGWEDMKRFTGIFGFPSVEHIHFSEVTLEKIEAIDPAMIILSPKSEDVDRSIAERMIKGVLTTLEYEAPLVGICLGHQALAMTRGGHLVGKAEVLDDGTQVPIGEWGPCLLTVNKEDPLFKGLPRYPRFCASESHMAMINEEFDGADLLASTEFCQTQIYHYPGKPWYTFQCHIEREWEYNCPEAYLLWKNLFRYFFLIP